MTATRVLETMDSIIGFIDGSCKALGWFGNGFLCLDKPHQKMDQWNLGARTHQRMTTTTNISYVIHTLISKRFGHTHGNGVSDGHVWDGG